MTTTETDQKLWHLSGNWTPMLEEITANDLKVEGSIPEELSGTYLRVGPNPSSGWSPHWFFGDGMLHGISLENGKALWYKNRFVKTRVYKGEAGDDPMAAMGDLTMGTANTHVVRHAGKILALEEGHFPYELTPELETIGPWDFDGKLNTSMTAHPKICPETGEMMFFSYFNFEAPYLNYHRVNADGELIQSEGIDIPNIVMMHDFNITRNHTIFMDLPLTFNLEAIDESGLPFRFDPEAGARLGVMKRDGDNNSISWLEIDPCYVFHPVNAHEEGENIIIHVSRLESAFANSADDYSAQGHLWKWTIDTTTGKVSEEQIDDKAVDFGRVDDRRVGLPARFGYVMSLPENKDSVEYGESLYKYDFATGERLEHKLGSGVKGGEPVFAPASSDAKEDQGWIMCLVHDENTNTSKFIIIDAQDFESDPVATIHIPQRVPYGAHGSWMPN